jgi:hypothetical protein
MIGYRFLSPAEEEMTEASLFYDAASSGLGMVSLTIFRRRSIGRANILRLEKQSLLI